MKRIKRKNHFGWIRPSLSQTQSRLSSILFRAKPSFDGLRPSGWRLYVSLALLCLLAFTGFTGGLLSLGTDVYAAVNSIRPNGDGTITGWTTSGGGTTNLYAEADDDPDSPTDADYILGPNRSSSQMFVDLNDLPADFVSATSVEIKSRHQEQSVGNDTMTIYYQLFASNESTALTAETAGTLLGANTWALSTYTPSITGTNDKTTWDGAKLRIRQVYSQAQGGDDSRTRVSAAEINVTYTPVATFDQSAYRFYANQNSTDVGSALAAQNTGAVLTSTGQAFRMRMLIGVSAVNVAQNGQTFKLQFRSKGAACDATGSWADITTSTLIAYNNNATPADGAALTANANDPTIGGSTTRNQTYEELNNFTNSQLAINIGENGKWDFSLKDNGAASDTTYCMRAVKSDSTALNTYTAYPEVSTPPPPINQRAYIFEQDDGSTVNGNTDNAAANTALTNVKIGERLAVRVQIDYTGASSVTDAKYQLYFDKNDNNFVPVKVGAELAPTSGASGTTGDALTAVAAGTCTGGTSFTNGLWHEQTNVSRPITLTANQCTELAFMIDTSMASANTTYRLKLRKGTQELATYTAYPTLTTVASATGQIRSSKDTLASIADCTDTSWGCETIDASGDTGTLWISLAIDHDGDPWVSYYDATSTALKVAHYVGSGGSCTSTKWDCFLVDNSGTTTGSNTSMGVDPQGRVWISYRDASNDLKVAVNYDHPNMSACTASGWDCVVVENTANDLGYETSIAFDSNGNPWISYNDSTAFAVRIATFVGSGGNCTSTAWNCDQLDALGTNALDGDWSSIAFDSNGYAWVSYFDGTSSAMKVATNSSTDFPGAGACTLTGWYCAIVDNNSTTLGEATSLAINPATDKPMVVYEGEGTGSLRYAELVGSSGNCTSTAWNCGNIETGISVVPDPSLQFSPDGNAWVTFFSNFPSGTNRRLRVAKYVGSGGNCNNTAWSCSDVDTQSVSTGEYAHDKAFKFDPSGTGWVAYRDNTNSNLKVAKTHQPHFTNPLKYELNNTGYTATGSTNASYDQMSGSTHQPMYRFTSVHSNNTDTIAPTWVGRSNVAASTNTIRVQIYRFGTTNAWQEIAANTSCTANNSCTITPTTISTNLSEYYQAEDSNYLLHFRVLQDSGTTKTLETDNFSLASLGGGSNTAPSSPTSPGQVKVTGGTTISTGGWTSESQIKLTASSTDPDASDTLQLCVERQPLGTAFTNTETLCGTGVAYSGSAVTTEVTLTGLSEGEYHWQARVKDAGGLYSAWISYGGNAETARDFGVDTTQPTGTVYDGTNTGVDGSFNDGSLTSLSANWNITTTISGLSGYEYSIGTTAGATDIRTWTSVGTSTSVTASSLTLMTSQAYYFNIRVTDNAGNTATISSNGQMVSPSLGLSVSGSTLTFSAMNAANSYTATSNVTLTVTTNAKNGYQVRASATQNLTDPASRVIGMFSGGSYAAPAAWGSGTGFGYNSSDTNVGGSNRFNSATCPGGGSSPCYAPYTTTLPGDVIVDSSAPATAGDGYTIANRVTTSSSQAAGKYTTTLRYSANATY
jgi:hypothetical protein